jgi:hypothetical protein
MGWKQFFDVFAPHYRDSQAKAPGFIPGMKRSSLRPSRRRLACCLLMARMVK